MISKYTSKILNNKPLKHVFTARVEYTLNNYISPFHPVVKTAKISGILPRDSA
jgi:hypothetical protein